MQTIFTYLHCHAHRIRHWNRTGIILSMLFWLRVAVARNTNQICCERERREKKIRLFVTFLRHVNRQCAWDDLNFKGYPNESFTCKSGFFCYFSVFLGFFFCISFAFTLSPHSPLSFLRSLFSLFLSVNRALCVHPIFVFFAIVTRIHRFKYIQTPTHRILCLSRCLRSTPSLSFTFRIKCDTIYTISRSFSHAFHE